MTLGVKLKVKGRGTLLRPNKPSDRLKSGLIRFPVTDCSVRETFSNLDHDIGVKLKVKGRGTLLLPNKPSDRLKSGLIRYPVTYCQRPRDIQQ